MENKMTETSNSNSINLGDSLTLSALQLTLLCDRAIERYLKMFQEYEEENRTRVFFTVSPPETLEAARDEVIELFRSQSKDATIEEK